MKLYHHPISPYSQKALLGFYEKEVEFDAEIITLTDPAARERYERDVHPLGKVPMLVLDDGHRIPESTIILEYIDTHFDSGTQLIPDDREHARRTRYHDRMSDLYVMDPVVTLFFESRKKEEDRDAKRAELAGRTLEKTMPLFDAALKRGPWIMGDAFTMADCAFAPALFYLRRIESLDRWEHVAAYWSRIEERPSWMKLMEALGPFAKVFQKA